MLWPIHHVRIPGLLNAILTTVTDLQRLALYWFHAPDCNWTTKFRSQRTSHVEPSATSTTVTGPVGERLQAGTEDAPVLDCPAPLRRLPDSGAGYKYPDLLTYLPITVLLYNGLLLCGFKGLNNKSLLGGARLKSVHFCTRGGSRTRSLRANFDLLQ